jgi:hypothetical protein
MAITQVPQTDTGETFTSRNPVAWPRRGALGIAPFRALRVWRS